MKIAGQRKKNSRLKHLKAGLSLISIALLSNCVVFEQIDKLPEPAVHAIMVPITLGLPLLLVNE